MALGMAELCRQPLGQTRARVEAVGTGKAATVQAPPRENYINLPGPRPECPLEHLPVA